MEDHRLPVCWVPGEAPSQQVPPHVVISCTQGNRRVTRT